MTEGLMTKFSSGFKDLRQILLFTIGAAILLWILVTQKPDQYNTGLLIFCGALMGLPYVLGDGNKKNEH